MKKLLFSVAILAFLSSPALGIAAEKYPTKAIEMVVPFPAGGATDVMARLIGKFSTKYLDKQLVVVNKPAGGGITGTESVVRSKPDGYTL
jgi:tripartite-type tricarboxylate transporter receptor subunit TctC